jgi:hypothetical protein
VAIRDATPEDWPAIWSFLRDIVAAGDTYAYDPGMSEYVGLHLMYRRL